jgi:hypothetical protein
LGQKLQGGFALAAVLVIALALRLFRLEVHDFWYDEVFAAMYTKFPSASWNPVLYWDILSAWAKTFGVSELSLRFLPMLFSFLTTVVVFLLGKELFDRKTALFSTWLIALSPFHLWYAQEARDYAMVVFVGTLASYVLFMALKQSSFKKWGAFVLLSLAGAYMNYFYLFLLAAQSLYVFYVSQFRIRKVFFPFLLVAAVYSLRPVESLQGKFSAFLKGALWIPRPDWQSMPITLQDYLLGYNGTAFLYTLASCAALAAFIHLFFIARKKKDMQPNISFCVFLFMIPILSVFLFSKLFFSVYLTRGLLLFSPYFYLLIAYAVMEWRREVRAVMAAILIGISSCGAYLYFADHWYLPFEYHVGAYLKKPVRPVVDYLSAHVGENDIVALTSLSMLPGIVFYSNERFQPYYLRSPQVLDIGQGRFMLSSNIYIPGDEIINYKFEKLWVVFTDWGRVDQSDPNSALLREWLNEHLQLMSIHRMDGLQISSYRKKEFDPMDGK